MSPHTSIETWPGVPETTLTLTSSNFYSGGTILAGGTLVDAPAVMGGDALLAEGLPAESYLDWGDRPFFTEGSDHALQNLDFVVPGLVGRCRPVALDGPLVEAERRRLDALFATSLAAQCDWPDGSRSICDRTRPDGAFYVTPTSAT